MHVGYFQYGPEFAAPQRNLGKVMDALSGVKADLIVLPELAFTGYYFEDRAELYELAEDPADSRTVARLTRFCRDRGMHIVTGFAERYRDRLYNAALLVGPSGVLHHYRKLHLFNTEKEYFDPGDTPPAAVTLSGARLGVMICFDWVFPEVARALALQGAELICHPANLVLAHCQTAMRTRSLENAVFSITANRTGRERRPRGELLFTGQSQILDTQGDLLAGSGAREEVVVVREVDLSPARNKWITANNDLLADRRPEFYGSLIA
jgi:predicted amidohydrolase